LIRFTFHSDKIFHLAFTALVLCSNIHCLATIWKQCTGFRKHIHMYTHIHVYVKGDIRNCLQYFCS